MILADSSAKSALESPVLGYSYQPTVNKRDSHEIVKSNRIYNDC